jgi:hypothetical protein
MDAVSAERTRRMFENLMFEDFKDRVGAGFVIREDEFPPLVLTLAEATALPARFAGAGARPPFSLIFSGSLEHALPQRLYRLQHEALGDITLFLVPVGKDAQSYSYQALFN